ncbi:MAG: hypothetical protein Q8K63_15615 [Acidimicrobiales bacterium]|nr:hypothetical protein [Acidimicrobiales bacterium]
MRKAKVILLSTALAFTGLAACGSGGGGDSRTILVDYQTDDFAAAFLGYYPRNFTVTPGMTVKFEQAWTGEPHSVTMGKIVDEGYAPIAKVLDGYLDGTTPIPDEPPAEYNEEIWEQKLPYMFGDGDGEVNQSAALPCYAPKESDLPQDKSKPCAKEFRDKPEFDGTHAYYSSGFIPFEGELANEFELKLADDIDDGKYAYYCNLHGILMSGQITVDRDAKIESQGDLNRRGREEVERVEKTLRTTLNKERAGKGRFPLPLAGSGDELSDSVMASAVEFTPRTINTTVGQKVTWTFIGDHTIAFNVPPYTPLYTFDKRGHLKFNTGLEKARGGWPGAPEREGADGPPDPNAPEREPFNVDAGEFDGSGGIKSSGIGWSDGDKYSVTFTKPGTYPYACLIHPGQIGKVVVK